MSQNKLRKIFVFADWFEPGYKAGGPIRSCVNFAENMKSDYLVFVFTTDRDLGDQNPYESIEVNEWVSIDENINLFYASPSFLTWTNIKNLVNLTKPDFIYLNSMFSRYFTVYPLLMKKFRVIKQKLILSPRGMLKSTALEYKPAKKKLFLGLFKLLRIPDLVSFQATDTTELNDIRKQFGKNVNVTLLTNFHGKQKPYIPPAEKIPGKLSMIFIGRIHPIKNLHFLLELLSESKDTIQLSVVAPVEDETYWNLCRQLINRLPSNIKVQLYQELPHGEIENLLYRKHVFVLPTCGENFGHAIFEALAAGRPVLISDQTPWRNLASGHVGWDIDLKDKPAFLAAIRKLASMDYAEISDWSAHAWQYCNTFMRESNIKREYLKLFS